MEIANMDNFYLLLPLYVFLAGIAVHYGRRTHKLNNERLNIRAILSKEMMENYRRLNRILPLESTTAVEKYGISELSIIHLVAGECNRLSFMVFEKYLDRLYILNTEEIHTILDSYFIITNVFERSEEYFKLKHDWQDEEDTNKIFQTGLVVWWDAEGSLDYLEVALENYQAGRDFLRGQSEKRASALASTAEAMLES